MTDPAAPHHDPLDVHVVLDTTHEAFIAMDEQGRVSEWNRAAEELFGWTRSEALDRELADLIVPPKLRDAHRRGLRHFLDTGEGPVLDKRLELPALDRAGRTHDVEITISAPRVGDRHFFHAFLHDVSDRHRRETHREVQLGASEALARTSEPAVAIASVLRTACDAFDWQYGGCWTASEEAGQLVDHYAWHLPDEGLDAFEAAARALQFQPDRGLPGMLWQSGESKWFQAVSDHPQFLRARHAKRADLCDACFVSMVADGQVVGLLEFFAHSMPEPDAEQMSLLRSIGALTGQFLQRKRAERAVTDMKDAFVAMVSHELRTPLTSIGGFAQTIRDRHHELTDEEHLAFATIICDQTERLTRLVEDLLTFSRMQGGSLRPRLTVVDLPELVRTALSELGERDVAVTTSPVEPDGHELHAIVDVDHIRQIVLNLVGNAHSYGAAPVEVEVRRVDGTIQLRVCDHGPGVSPAFLPELFEPFTRDDASTTHPPGTGIGLSIVRSLAELQSGSVTYEERDGGGACFVVSLPAVPRGGRRDEDEG